MIQFRNKFILSPVQCQSFHNTKTKLGSKIGTITSIVLKTVYLSLSQYENFLKSPRPTPRKALEN